MSLKAKRAFTGSLVGTMTLGTDVGRTFEAEVKSLRRTKCLGYHNGLEGGGDLPV